MTELTASDIPQPEVLEEATESGHNLATRLAGIAGYLEQLPRGERAEIRRLRRGATLPPEVFWRIVERYDIDESDEPFWIAVLPLMVKHPHARGRRPGVVLEAAGVSSARLERWLRLDRQGAWREAGRLLSRVEEPLDWVQLGFVLYAWDDEKYRRRLARDFFRARERRTATSQAEGGE